MAVPRTVLMGQRLWRQAERDLRSAKMNLQPDSYYVAANLAHQAAEKALKAAHWHLRAEEASWTHDLRSVEERLMARPEDIPVEVDAAITFLSPVFRLTRYPSGDINDPIPADTMTEADATKAINSAEEVMRWVQMLLTQPPGKPRRT